MAIQQITGFSFDMNFIRPSNIQLLLNHSGVLICCRSKAQIYISLIPNLTICYRCYIKLNTPPRLAHSLERMSGKLQKWSLVFTWTTEKGAPKGMALPLLQTRQEMHPGE